MMAFDLVSGVCGIIALLVLCVQGALLLRTERHVFSTRDPARALAMAKGACQRRHLKCQELQGTAAGITITGRAYKLHAIQHEGEPRELVVASGGQST